jgi:hypothetical protein
MDTIVIIRAIILLIALQLSFAVFASMNGGFVNGRTGQEMNIKPILPALFWTAFWILGYVK